MELDSDFDNGVLYQRYKFVEYIETGTYGKVFKAIDLTLNEPVSIKALARKYIPIANHEIGILQQLRGNVNICQLKHHFVCSNSIYIVLEYCECDLYGYYRTHDISSSELYRIAKQLYNAVEYCHSKGIYHRDLKPENILINKRSGIIKLCDWGLATTDRINNEFNVGSEKYMAPEVFVNNYNSTLNLKYYDCKFVDYWSFGITLITLLFRRSPFKSINGKGLIHDSNYKKFVLYNEKQILFDIFPNLNQMGFIVFSHVLKISGIDDHLNGFLDQIKQRNLRQFMLDLKKFQKIGLTIDEEDTFYESDLVVDAIRKLEVKAIPPKTLHKQQLTKVVEMVHNQILVDTHLDWFDF